MDEAPPVSARAATKASAFLLTRSNDTEFSGERKRVRCNELLGPRGKHDGKGEKGGNGLAVLTGRFVPPFPHGLEYSCVEVRMVRAYDLRVQYRSRFAYYGHDHD